MKGYLESTFFFDWETPSLRHKIEELTAGLSTPHERAKALFYFVRDAIRYNPYTPKDSPEEFRASKTLARGEGYCVQKAVLLVAMARGAGIPARLGFAIIRNHLMPPKLLEVMGTDIFPWHGYAELHLGKRWIKATPAFDIEMCNKYDILPVEFDGIKDAKFHPRDRHGRPHIEYLLDRGPFEDLPFVEIQKALEERRLLRPPEDANKDSWT